MHGFVVCVARPTVSPALFSQIACEKLPPSVFKSISIPWSQRNAGFISPVRI